MVWKQLVGQWGQEMCFEQLLRQNSCVYIYLHQKLKWIHLMDQGPAVPIFWNTSLQDSKRTKYVHKHLLCFLLFFQ